MDRPVVMDTWSALAIQVSMPTAQAMRCADRGGLQYRNLSDAPEQGRAGGRDSTAATSTHRPKD